MRLGRPLRLGGVAVAIIAAGAAARGPASGGVYPLRHGVYVATDTRCADPPFAVLQRYDGRGLSGAHSRACVARVLSRRGSTYRVSQSCIDAGAGPAPRSTERQVVRIDSPRRFTLGTGRGATVFRYCTPASLPPGIASALNR